MNRIILGMAITAYLLAAITSYLGLLVDRSELVDPNSLGAGAFRYHFPLGLLSVLFAVFTHCMVFTYFLGTTRWVKETAGAYALDGSFAARSQRCRSRGFALAMASILLLVLTIASGAGAHTRAWPLWVHQVVPALTYAFMVFAFRGEYLALEQHMALTDEVMVEVTRRRRARGQMH